MKKWKITKNITISVIVIFIIRVILDVVLCMNMKYPHLMLGLDAYHWTDQFKVDMIIMSVYWGPILIIDILLLIISIKKLKKIKN